MLRRLVSEAESRVRLALAIVVLLLAVLAWHNRFIQDDAFISFRYARNLVEGHGLVWNIGERVEGYTNFLWVLLVSGALYLGIEPVAFTFVVGLTCFIFSLIFTFKIAELVLRSRDWALLTVFLLGTNYTFSSYATGGLETQLQALLFTVAVYLVLLSIREGRQKTGRLWVLSFVCACAVLTRMDSGLVVFVCLATALAGAVLGTKGRPPRPATKVWAAVLPAMMIIGAWLTWKLWYYGDLLPNTYYAKASPGGDWKEGVSYVGLFLVVYWLAPFALFVAAGLFRMARKPYPLVLIIAAVMAVWLLYVIQVGGDFMEFRMLVPVMPLGFVLLMWFMQIAVRWHLVRMVMVAVIVGGSASHMVHSIRGGYSLLETRHIETIQLLQNPMTSSEENWADIGRVLGQSFDYSPDVTIAVLPAGAIPYYSRLRCVDMLGLNDRWIARHGDVPRLKMAGHRRMSPFSYLVKRKVDLVIGHPVIHTPVSVPFKRFASGFRAYWSYGLKDPSELPPDTKVVVIPMNETYGVVALYIHRNRVVDRAIIRNGWQTDP